MKTSALAVNTQTQQLLPLGSNTCTQLSVTNFTPYIYNGSLDSFEFTVSDPSYVALLGSVGNTSIPFNFMTRQMDASGNLRIHVDIPSTPVTGSLPVTITLLSAQTGAPVCISIVSVDLGSQPSTSVNPVTTTTSYTPPVSNSGTGTANTGTQSGTNATSPASSMSTTGEMVTGTSGAPVASATESPLNGICSSQASAYRLWLVLLVAYALIVGLLLWAEFPLSWSWAQTPERVASTILILLLVLLGFWYFSIACRAALWMPLLAFLIAILGLLAAFWNHPRVTQMLLVQESKS